MAGPIENFLDWSFRPYSPRVQLGQHVPEIRHSRNDPLPRQEVAVERLNRSAGKAYGRHRDDRPDSSHHVVAKLLHPGESLVPWQLEDVLVRVVAQVEPGLERHWRANGHCGPAISL